MVESKKGTFKRKVAEFEIRDSEISLCITKALIEAGYELISDPIIDKVSNYGVGENIAVYRVIE